VELSPSLHPRVVAAFRLEHAASPGPDGVRPVGRAFSTLEMLPHRARSLLASQAESRNVLFFKLPEQSSRPEPAFLFATLPSAVTAMGVNRNGTMAAAGCSSGALVVHRVLDGSLASEHPHAHRGGVAATGFAGINCLASGGRDGRFCVWDLGRGQLIPLQWLSLGPCRVTSVAAYAPLGVTAAPEAWQLSELSRREPKGAPRCVFAAGTDVGEVHVMELDEGGGGHLRHRATFTLSEQRESVTSVTVDRSGSRVVAGGPGAGSRNDGSATTLVIDVSGPHPVSVVGRGVAEGFLVGCEFASSHDGARDDILMIATMAAGPVLRAARDIAATTFFEDLAAANADMSACRDTGHGSHRHLRGAASWQDASEALVQAGLPALPLRDAAGRTGDEAETPPRPSSTGKKGRDAPPTNDATEAPIPRGAKAVPAPVARDGPVTGGGRGGADGPGKVVLKREDVIQMPDEDRSGQVVEHVQAPGGLPSRAKDLTYDVPKLAPHPDRSAPYSQLGDRRRASGVSLRSRIPEMDGEEVAEAIGEAHAQQLRAAPELGRPGYLSTLGLERQLDAARSASFDAVQALRGIPGQIARKAAAQEVTHHPLPVTTRVRDSGVGLRGSVGEGFGSEASGSGRNGRVGMYEELPVIDEAGAPERAPKVSASDARAVQRARARNGWGSLAYGTGQRDRGAGSSKPPEARPDATQNPAPANPLRDGEARDGGLYVGLPGVGGGRAPVERLRSEMAIDPGKWADWRVPVDRRSLPPAPPRMEAWM